MSERKNILSMLPLSFGTQMVRMFLDEQGLPWWVAQDVADILGILEAKDTLRYFPEDEKGACTIHTHGGPQRALSLNEPGLYRLIFQSRKPQAEAFKRWVFHDILPTLRRTGRYDMAAAESGPLPLTAQGMLPPPPPKPREHAEVSWHLLAVFCLLRDHDEWLSNHEIAQRTGIAPRTARAHTYYLFHLGMIERQEAFPRHLHHFAQAAPQRNGGVFQRLCQMAEIVQARRRF